MIWGFSYFPMKAFVVIFVDNLQKEFAKFGRVWANFFHFLLDFAYTIEYNNLRRINRELNSGV